MRIRAKKLAPLAAVLAGLGFGLVPGTANAEAPCDGGYEFHWHWTDAPVFFDTTMANSTITINRCWDGHGNLTSGTATIRSFDNAWGSFNRAKVIDGAFQVTRSAGQVVEGYLPEALAYGDGPPAAQVKVTVSIGASGDMSVNTDPAPYIEQGADPGFRADGDYGSSDYGQFVPPPPQG